MAKKIETFDDFLKRRETISGDFINGDAEGLLQISTVNDPSTFFPPTGARISGASGPRLTFASHSRRVQLQMSGAKDH